MKPRADDDEEFERFIGFGSISQMTGAIKKPKKLVHPIGFVWFQPKKTKPPVSRKRATARKKK